MNNLSKREEAISLCKGSIHNALSEYMTAVLRGQLFDFTRLIALEDERMQLLQEPHVFPCMKCGKDIDGDKEDHKTGHFIMSDSKGEIDATEQFRVGICLKCFEAVRPQGE